MTLYVILMIVAALVETKTKYGNRQQFYERVVVDTPILNPWRWRFILYSWFARVLLRSSSSLNEKLRNGVVS